ncbi:vacuolar ATPase assembly integral membrane protein vma21 [Myotisia sp. PD_48]|nr:vacuolar ATPase assembly integral membrane protein vma21 [Myotisia sp. PD_48]
MATRRGVSKDLQPSSSTPTTRPEDEMKYVKLPGQVLWKLILYTIIVITAPMAAYFYSLNQIFDGNTTYAGATAAGTANVVLIIYIIVAMREDQGDSPDAGPKPDSKKNL